ncbi:MAG: hypothetical protein ACREOF_21990 [Gemmatimonadales bacterium]
MPAPTSRRPSLLVRLHRSVLPVLLGTLLACEGDGATAPVPSLGSANGPNGKNATVRITPGSDTLDALYDTLQLTANASAPTWSSLNPNVAKVDASGRVVSVGPGLGLIEAVVGRKADTAAVLVRQIPASLEVTPDSIILGFQGVDTLAAVVADANGFAIAGTPVTWTSDDSAVATVVEGVVAAIDAGVTWVRAVFDTFTDSTHVDVPASPYP